MPLSSPRARPAVLLEMDIAASPIDVRADSSVPSTASLSLFPCMISGLANQPPKANRVK